MGLEIIVKNEREKILQFNSLKILLEKTLIRIDLVIFGKERERVKVNVEMFYNLQIKCLVYN